MSLNPTQSIGQRFVLRCLQAVWGLQTYCCLTELSWENGYGVTPWRGRPWGDWWSKLNLAACGEGGVPMMFLDPAGLECGKTLRGGEGTSLDL